MHRPARLRSIALLVSLCAAVVLSSCGLGTAGGRVQTGELTGPLTNAERLDGVELKVGSKNFSENVILGKMAVILFASAGADVEDLTNIPGSAAARQAQVEGQIDAMWEYTGTGWVAYLGHDKGIPNEKKQYEAVRDEDFEKNELVWLEPAPLNNQYAFAITQDVKKKLNVEKLSDISSLPVKERTFCVESEFTNRPDGLIPMLKTYDMPLGQPNGVPDDNLRTYQTGAIYDATDKGECNFGEVFTTDGRIVALDLTVLEDDKKALPNYNVSMVLRNEVLEEHPQIKELLAPVTAKLTDELMLDLNAQVDLEGKEPADVAYKWLKDEGFIE